MYGGRCKWVRKACLASLHQPDIPAATPSAAAAAAACVSRYQQQLAACSPIRLLDLRDMQKQVPLPTPPADHPPVFVLGGEDDKVLDVQSYTELAE
jgi:hypothetical protein